PAPPSSGGGAFAGPGARATSLGGSVPAQDSVKPCGSAESDTGRPQAPALLPAVSATCQGPGAVAAAAAARRIHRPTPPSAGSRNPRNNFEGCAARLRIARALTVTWSRASPRTLAGLVRPSFPSPEVADHLRRGRDVQPARVRLDDGVPR